MKNLANTLFQKTPPNKEMPGGVFEALMESAILEHGSDTDYYFKSKHGNYEILFGTDGNTISVDTFGFKHNKGWIELEYTDTQFNEMKRKIESVPDRNDDSYTTDDYIDFEFENGHKPEDFY